MDESDDLRMPEAHEGFIKTLNNTGYMTVALDRFSQAFVEFSTTCQHPVLDVGAAFGVATLKALGAGATVIANDIDERHLQVLAERVPTSDQKIRLACLCGAFPDLDVMPQSLSAALVSRVMHFLDGKTIERSARKLYDWIIPDGKVFVISETPFTGTLRSFVVEYEKRKQAGDPWPGLITDMMKYSPRASALPKLGNWLDVDVLTRVFTDAGFTIDECAYFGRPEFPEWLQNDGRESVGLIATRPPNFVQ